MRGAVLVVLLLASAGCLSQAPSPQDAVDGTDADVESGLPGAPPAPSLTWFPLEPTAGEAVLFEAPEGATHAIWLIGTQRHEGRIVQAMLAEGTHPVTLRFMANGTQELHDNITVLPVPATPTPPPEEAAEEAAAPPPALSAPQITVARQGHQASFRIDWPATPSRVDWFFGDGSTSNQQEPTHAYQSTGAFTVRAVVWLAADRYEPVPVTVEVDDVPLSMQLRREGTTVYLAANWDHTDAAFTWTFGDGSAAAGALAEHTYETAGPFTITLRGEAGDDEATTQAIVFLDDFPLHAEASLDDNIATYTSSWGFEDVAYQWYFGDGGRSNDPNPTHRYPALGTYTVTLQVRSGDVVNATSFEVTVDEMRLRIDGELDIHSFTGSAFWDLPADPFNWTMGDATSYELQRVAHDYAVIGAYTITLTATDGLHIERVALPITVWTLPPEIQHEIPPGNVASFAYTWTHDADDIVWSFGGGGTSTEPRPSHVFSGGIGTYVVSVTLSHPELRAVGIDAVTGTTEVEVLFDGIPQFQCGGVPVYEPHVNHGEDGRQWMALKDGQRLAVVWETETPSTESIDVLEAGVWTTYTETNATQGHVFVLDDVAIGSEVCIRWADALHAVRMVNAWNHHDGFYRINYLVQTPGVFDQDLMQEGVEAAADLLVQATRGHVAWERVVIVHDWSLYSKPGSAPGASGYPCASEPRVKGTFGADLCQIFDVQIAASTPGAGGFTSLNGIQDKHASIQNDGSAYVGAEPGDAAALREFRTVFVHESGHYALGMSDKYVTPIAPPYPPVPIYSCYDSTNQVSIMGSSRSAQWFDTPEDPCPDSPWVGTTPLGVNPLNPLGPGRGPDEPYTPSWDEMRVKHPLVPATLDRSAGLVGGAAEALTLSVVDFGDTA